MTLTAASLGIWVALHRNLFGPGGQILPWFESTWSWLAGLCGHPDAAYPVTAWAEGFILRSALALYAAGYLAILAVLRLFRWGRQVRLRTLLIVGVVIGVPLILAPYLMSSDVFDYSAQARVWVVHGSNPYASSISEFPTDPLYEVTCWKSATSVYGPAYTMLAIAIVHAAEALGGSLAIYVLIHKLLMFGFQLASAALIWRILSEAGVRDRGFKTALFLLNPIVMIEFPGNGHNEAMMIAFLLAAIALGQRGRWGLAAISFALAVQTKLYCLPIFCFYVAHRCWKAESAAEAARRFASMTAVFTAVCLLLYLPFGLTATTVLAPLHGPGGDSMTKSLGDYFAYKATIKLDELPLIGVFFRGYQPEDVHRFGLIATFFACMGGVLYARSLSRAVTAMAFFSLFWCLIGATWFMPWYVTLPVALMSISESKSIGWSSGLLSFTVFLIYLLEGWSFSPDPGPHNYAVLYFELMVFIPPLIVLAVVGGWERCVGRKRSGTLPLRMRSERAHA